MKPLIAILAFIGVAFAVTLRPMANRENGRLQTIKPLRLLSTWSVNGPKRLALTV
jgi:hypothetical protein